MPISCGIQHRQLASHRLLQQDVGKGHLGSSELPKGTLLICFLLHVHARIHVVKAQRVALSLECVELTDELVSPKEFSFAFSRFCQCQFVRTCHLKDVA